MLQARAQMRKNCLAVFTVVAAACAPTKDDGKGVIDESGPPSIPTESGKADDSLKIVEIDVQSGHPYANNLDQVYPVSLAGLPGCAREARLHFSVLRTEAEFDVVTVEPTGAAAQAFDGDRDDTWTAWFPVAADRVDVRLASDGSITRHGFEIDQIEWDGVPVCPAVVYPACDAGSLDVAPTPGACACPTAPECAPKTELQIRHQTSGGFRLLAHHATGSVATETHLGPADAPETTEIGAVDVERLAALVQRAARLGLLQGPGYARPLTAGAVRDELMIAAGPYAVTFVADEGAHDPEVEQLIGDFEALFACGTPSGTLSCAAGFECRESTCMEVESCVCPANYAPVCSTSGRTYSNACAASCANVEIAHDGACGIPGDTCGTMLGLACRDDNKCRFGASQYTYPYPDAGGTCVAATYCDAAADCTGLPHIAVPGQWTCAANACAWQTEPVDDWQPVTDGAFETAHPYASSTSVWKAVFLPTGAQAMRLVTAAGFSLEAGYDFLEVWTWSNGAWERVTRYTGTVGPAATDEFPGRYHYLRFVSDSSITKHGFRVDAQWR